MRPAAYRVEGGDDAFERRARPLSLVSAVDLLQFGNSSLKSDRGPEFVERHAMVRRGESFARLLRLHDVSQEAISAFETAARRVFDLSRIHPRRSLTMFFDRRTDELAALEYSIDSMKVLVVERGADGVPVARLARTPSSVEIRAVAGTIGESTARDCAEAGVPDRIVSELTDIFAWDVDFDELAPGDRFRAVYEVAVGEDGHAVQTGAILAAEVETSRGVLTAVLYVAEDGDATYLDAQGRSLDRGQLRYPLEFTRITSGLSGSRFHPILRRSRPHNGVDFAAPKGTPVRAIADGTVAIAGWQEGYGKTVRIAHGDALPYDSIYAHLSRISAKLAVGGTVRRGEIIGYVGSTGLSTGSHLHFALYAGDQYVDPLTVSPPPRVVRQLVLGPDFERAKSVFASALALLQSHGPVRLTRLSRAGIGLRS